MSTIADGSTGGIQEFIFARELAEVYLLLDHISGRSQTKLSEVFRSGTDATALDAIQVEQDWLKRICEIGWPPETAELIDANARAEKAATLLVAKDRLNAAAAPANGASIVFTLMVAGDDDVTDAKLKRDQSFWHWWRNGPTSLFSRRLDGSLSASGEATDQAISGAEDGSGSPKAPKGSAAKQPPSRISLAQFAYPGLIKSARQFKTYFSFLLLLLFGFLLFTCLLSWNVAAGRALLSRLDTVELAKVVIDKRIVDAEIAAAKSPAIPLEKVERYCPETVPTIERDGQKIQQFNSSTQRQICDQLQENKDSQSNARRDIGDWARFWKWLTFAAASCNSNGNYCAHISPSGNVTEHPQWAAMIIDVLASSVLPLCYGFLGAGAAVVRGIWAKMRDSLLSPRDLSLSAGQLALGAVIGACISLFIAPSGTTSSGGVGLLSSVSLTPSALSFIAGLGVDSVFIALESLIKRVFNVPDRKSLTPAPVTK